MLTLRYNPEKRPVRPPLKPCDFIPWKQDDNDDDDGNDDDNIKARTVGIIKQEILKMARRKRPKCISLSLSGGIDSALTVAMLRSTLPDVKLECISIGFGDADDEVEQAREIARAHNCNFNEMKLSNILADLPKLISAVKEPRWNLYHYYALEKGRVFSDIFYSGDGGDELFGGYTFRYSKFLSLLPKKSGWKKRVKVYLDCHERDWVPDQAAMFGPKIRFSWDRIYGLLRPHFDNGLEGPLEQVFLADFNGKLLYDWMPANRAFEKLLGIEIRSIFLTQAMIRFATHIPWQLKYDPVTGIGKLPLRSILAAGKGPKLEPVKKGFAVNLVSLWDRNARELVSRYVNSGSETVRAGLVNPAWISKTMNRMRNEPDPRYINKMLGILALEVWHRLFVSRTIKGGQKL
jgi:asparagine synthase (glutamine-hydrolysing)